MGKQWPLRIFLVASQVQQWRQIKLMGTQCNHVRNIITGNLQIIFNNLFMFANSNSFVATCYISLGSPVNLICRFGGTGRSFCWLNFFLNTKHSFIHTFIHPFAEGPLLFLQCSQHSRGPLWGAVEPGLELGAAVQPADALLFELHRTLPQICRSLPSYAAP